MPWLKLSDDFADDCARAGISNEAFRTHVEGLTWAMRRLTGGRLTELDIRRCCEVEEPHLAIKELVQRGFWIEAAEGWQIVHGMDDQRRPEQIEADRAKARERMQRARSKEKG